MVTGSDLNGSKSKLIDVITSLDTLRTLGFPINPELFSLYQTIHEELVSGKSPSLTESPHLKSDGKDDSINRYNAFRLTTNPKMDLIQRTLSYVILNDSWVNNYQNNETNPELSIEQRLELVKSRNKSSRNSFSLEFDASMKFVMQHLSRIISLDLDKFMSAYLVNVPDVQPVRYLIKQEPTLPQEYSFFDTDVCTSDSFQNSLSDLLKNIRVVDYHPLNKSALLVPSTLEDLKDPSKFYGIESLKEELKEHFNRFASGKVVTPLILAGAPGMGKTKLAESYAYYNTKSIIVKLGGDLINTIDEVVDYFRTTSKPVILFFDDIPSNLQWSNFRNMYDGKKIRPPNNVSIVITSNYDFEQNVLSRAKVINFNKFNLPVIKGIVFDYLIREKGITDPSRLDELGVFLIQDYTHGESPQQIKSYYGSGLPPHKFDRKSPRGLVNYLLNMDAQRLNGIYKRIQSYRDMQEDMKELASIAYPENSERDPPLEEL